LPPGICQVNVWDVASKKPVLRLPSPDKAILAVTVSSDSKLIASGGVAGPIHLWNTATGQKIKTLRGHTGGLHALVFTADNGTLLSGGDDGTLRLWDVAQGKEKKQLGQGLAAPWSNIRSLCLSPDGATLLAAGRPMVLRLFNLATSSETLMAWDKDAPAVAESHGSRLWIILALVGACLCVSGWFLVRRFWPRDNGRSDCTEALEVAELAEEPPQPVIVACSGCGKKLKIRAELVGKRIKCPGCGQKLA
jgi:WD40 repeat protein